MLVNNTNIGKVEGSPDAVFIPRFVTRIVRSYISLERWNPFFIFYFFGGLKIDLCSRVQHKPRSISGKKRWIVVFELFDYK